MSHVLCSEGDCQHEAVAKYRWPWDDVDSLACDEHRTIVQQRAERLGRPVTFVALYEAPALREASVSDLEKLVAKLRDDLEVAQTLISQQEATIHELRAELGHVNT